MSRTLIDERIRTQVFRYVNAHGTEAVDRIIHHLLRGNAHTYIVPAAVDVDSYPELWFLVYQGGRHEFAWLGPARDRYFSKQTRNGVLFVRELAASQNKRQRVELTPGGCVN